MAITKRPSKAEELFTADAPDAKPAAKLHGKRQPITFALPPELVAQIDAAASRERRSRAKMIEIGMEDFLARYEDEAA